MWTCPNCNRIFEREKQMHSCKKVSLEEHFKNKDKAQELFKFLQSSKDTEEKRLASLEWAYLSLLDGYHGASPTVLHRSLQSDPNFFAELISRVFRSKNEPKKSKKSITEQESAIARNAYKLLSSIKQVPGVGDNGFVDEKKLTDWVTHARKACTESGHLEVCDTRIGEIFAFAPLDADGSFPCSAVRKVIEKVKSEELEHGFEIGVYNKRGVHSRSLTEGGKPEHELAKQYNDYADKCGLLFDRTVAALRRIAETYKRQAQLEDEKVEARLD